MALQYALGAITLQPAGHPYSRIRPRSLGRITFDVSCSFLYMSLIRPATTFYARSAFRASFLLRQPKLSRVSALSLKRIFRQQTLQGPHVRLFASMAPIERVTDKLEAPLLDDRKYRVIKLPNQLEALLVHDPDTDKASASVNVNVGSFSDADDMPGMAHAVEHLLFMGTEKVKRLHAASSFADHF